MRIVGLNSTPEPDKPIWNLIRDKLPLELYYYIMKYMDYDQVSWLSDVDSYFLRSLAKNRYNYIVPSLDSLKGLMCKDVAKTMRFGQNDDMWLVTLVSYDDDDVNDCVARRFAIKKGIYSWQTAAAVTGVRFDSFRSRCHRCTALLKTTLKCMSENEEATMFGRSKFKVFALQGSGDVPIDARYASPFFVEKTDPVEYDYVIHTWRENNDNNWMSDLEFEGSSVMNNETLKTLVHLKTMIFKDPVKFFGIKKVLVWIDKGILALTSRMNGEVLGYLVDDEHYSFRLPTTDSGQFVGLNFMPNTMYNTIYTTNKLVTHVRRHEIEEEKVTIENEIERLEQSLLEPGADVDALQCILDTARSKLMNIFETLQNGIKFNRTDIVDERIDANTIHIHETYEEDFDFCTRFFFYKTGMFEMCKVIENVAKTMFTRCPFERDHPDKMCTFNLANPDLLRSMYAVRMGKRLDDLS